MNPIVQIRHLKYRYPDTKNWAVNDVNLNLFKSEWLSLIGSNGSGKSTLVKLIDGLLDLDSGQVVVDHQVLTRSTVLNIRSKIGIVFQNPVDQFVGATVNDEVAFGLENQQLSVSQIKALIHRSLSLVGMTDYQNSLVNDLSGGQQQRIAIADVIALKPKIMILDECTSMLDPQSSHQILRLINELKTRFHLTILDITHDIEETKYAQRIAIMDKGRLITTGTPAQLFVKPKLFSQLHLALPAPDVLRDRLQRNSVKVPNQHFSETEMLSWLHKLFLNT